MMAFLYVFRNVWQTNDIRAVIAVANISPQISFSRLSIFRQWLRSDHWQNHSRKNKPRTLNNCKRISTPKINAIRPNRIGTQRQLKTGCLCCKILRKPSYIPDTIVFPAIFIFCVLLFLGRPGSSVKLKSLSRGRVGIRTTALL